MHSKAEHRMNDKKKDAKAVENGHTMKETSPKDGLQRELFFILLRQLEGIVPPTLHGQLVSAVEDNGLMPVTYAWDKTVKQENYSFLNGVLRENDSGNAVQVLTDFLQNHGLLSILDKIPTKDYFYQGLMKNNVPTLRLDLQLMNRSFGQFVEPDDMSKSMLCKNLELVLQVSAHKMPIYCCEYNRLGSVFITGADDGLVKIWNAKNGWLIRAIRGHQALVSDISMSGDNSLLATASHDGTVRIYDFETGEPIRVLKSTKVYHIINFHPVYWEENSFFMTLEYPGTVKLYLWKPKEKFISEHPVAVYHCGLSNRDEVRSAAWFNGGTRFITCGTDGLTRIFRTPSWDELGSGLWRQPTDYPDLVVFDDHEGYVNTLVANNNCDLIATGSNDGTVKLYRFDASNCIWKCMTLNCTSDSIAAMHSDITQTRAIRTKITTQSFTKAANHIVTTSTDFILRVWSTATGGLLHRLYYHVAEVHILTFHPLFDNVMLSAGMDGRIALWDVDKGIMLKDFVLENTKFDAGDVSPDGMHFVLTDDSGKFHLFSLAHDFDSFSKTPRSQFFPSESRGIILDRNFVITDEISQMQPHLMPSERICDEFLSPHPNQPTDFEKKVSWKITDFEYHQWRFDTIDIIEYEHMIYNIEKRCGNPEMTKKKYKRKVKYGSDDEGGAPTGVTTITTIQYIDDPDDEAYDAGSLSSSSSLDEDLLPDDDDDEIEGEDDLIIRQTRHSQHRLRHRHRNRPSRRSGTERSNPRPQRTRRARIVPDSSSELDDDELEDLIPARRSERLFTLADYLPTFWINSYERRTIPYFPQIGDIVVYISDGHREFQSKERRKTSAIPHNILPNQTCRVAGIEYLVGPPTFALLTLELLMSTGRSRGHKIQVKYYFRSDMSEFVILKSLYDYSVSQHWKADESVNIISEDGASIGKIATIVEPIGHESYWQTAVVYLNDHVDQLYKKCIWELQPDPADNPKKREPYICTEVLDPQISKLCINAIEQAMTLEIATEFIEPVDYELHTQYLHYIAYPMYLQLILSRLMNGYYRSLEAVLFDINLIEKNAITFNDENSDISQNAKQLVANILISIDSQVAMLLNQQMSIGDRGTSSRRRQSARTNNFSQNNFTDNSIYLDKRKGKEKMKEIVKETSDLDEENGRGVDTDSSLHKDEFNDDDFIDDNEEDGNVSETEESEEDSFDVSTGEDDDDSDATSSFKNFRNKRAQKRKQPHSSKRSKRYSSNGTKSSSRMSKASRHEEDYDTSSRRRSTRHSPRKPSTQIVEQSPLRRSHRSSSRATTSNYSGNNADEYQDNTFRYRQSRTTRMSAAPSVVIISSPVRSSQSLPHSQPQSSQSKHSLRIKMKPPKASSDIEDDNDNVFLQDSGMSSSRSTRRSTRQQNQEGTSSTSTSRGNARYETRSRNRPHYYDY